MKPRKMTTDMDDGHDMDDELHELTENPFEVCASVCVCVCVVK